MNSVRVPLALVHAWQERMVMDRIAWLVQADGTEGLWVMPTAMSSSCGYREECYKHSLPGVRVGQPALEQREVVRDLVSLEGIPVFDTDEELRAYEDAPMDEYEERICGESFESGRMGTPVYEGDGGYVEVDTTALHAWVKALDEAGLNHLRPELRIGRDQYGLHAQVVFDEQPEGFEPDDGFYCAGYGASIAVVDTRFSRLSEKEDGDHYRFGRAYQAEVPWMPTEAFLKELAALPDLAYDWV